MTRIRGRQNGETVFEFESSEYGRAEALASRIAPSYAATSDLEVQHHSGGRWRRRAMLKAGTKDFVLKPIPEGARSRGFASQTEERKREISALGVAARRNKG